MPCTVLAVDDHAVVLSMLADLIEQDPRLVLTGTAENGQEAVEQVTSACPDAIILDVRMPVMDGLEALPQLRRACPECIIVMYSSEPTVATEALRLGADEVVDKASDATRLLDLLVSLWTARSQD